MNEQSKTTTVTAPDIVCGGCANAIKKALGELAGVERVEVDVESKAVTVAHRPTVSRAQLVEMLDLAGFPAA